MAKYTYYGPAHVLIVGGKEYVRPADGTVDVDISKEVVAALAGHQFYEGDTQLYPPVSLADQSGRGEPQPVAVTPAASEEKSSK